MAHLDRALRYGVAALVVLAFGVLLGTLLTLAEGGEWDPLGDYPVQSVVAVTPTSVTTDGLKCNDSDEDVMVRGTLNWQRTDRREIVIFIGEGTATRPPGCERTVWENPIPAAVLEANEPGAVWIITGTEVPFDDDHASGRSRTWETETFEIP